MTAAKHEEPKKAKASDEPDMQTEVAKIAAAIKTLTEAGVGGQIAAHVAVQVWTACCCK